MSPGERRPTMVTLDKAAAVVAALLLLLLALSWSGILDNVLNARGLVYHFWLHALVPTLLASCMVLFRRKLF
jgi:hypothetical protein